MLVAISGLLLAVLLLTVLLARVRVLLMLCWRWVGRVAAVGIVALVELALRGAVAVLLGSVLVMRRGWVLALRAR